MKRKQSINRKYTLYELSSGRFRSRSSGPRPINPREGFGYVAGHWSKETHYADLTRLEKVKLPAYDENGRTIKTRDRETMQPIEHEKNVPLIGENGSQVYEKGEYKFEARAGDPILDENGEPILNEETGDSIVVFEDYEQPTPTLKTPWPYPVSYQCKVGEELVIPVSPGSETLDFTDEYEQIGVDIISDGTIEREYDLAGTYYIWVQDVKHNLISLEIVVSV